MHVSMKELVRLRLRSKLYSPFIGIGIILMAVGIILALVEGKPFVISSHTFMLILGTLSTFTGFFLYQNEEVFAQKYDMTHLLDIDDKEERYQAYMEHLSEWIATDLNEINPVRTRGSDPSGPDWGKTDFKLGHEPKRRDAIVQGEKYSGMEGDLTSTEKMVADANIRYGKMAQKRWEIAEANDSDLIEYGVGRLGDLVKTDYFDKNAEDGAFTKVANPDDNTH